MNTMKYIMFFLINFNLVHGINDCSDQEHSPLCFCRSTYQHSILPDFFLAKLSLFQCNDFLSPNHCHQSRFYPPSFHLTQLIPQLSNHSHCLEDIHCLHTLNLTEHCRQCQVLPSLLIDNDSYNIDACFNFCEHNTSCGFVCLNQTVILSINCDTCRGRKHNVSCRCIKSSPLCLSSSSETTTPRWMQKRGFPAAAILALLILFVVLLVVAFKLTYRQLDKIDRRRSIAARLSALPITSQQSLSILPHTPQIVHTQVQQLVVELHRCDEENELSILLLEENTLKN